MGARRSIELGRPVLFLLVFLLAAHRWGFWAAPLAFVVVFAFAVLVHDLLHNSLRFSRGVSEVVLGVFALFLLKSGHALRDGHVRHHAECLSDGDDEGGVAHQPVWRLVVLGPWIALEARFTSLQKGASTRRWQVLEGLANLASLAALVALAPRHPAAGMYLLAVFVVGVTAPLWGAKVPHSLPVSHPLLEALRARAGRWTPALSSVVFHELHHRSPRIPVALLAEHREELEQRPPSPCVANQAP